MEENEFVCVILVYQIRILHRRKPGLMGNTSHLRDILDQRVMWYHTPNRDEGTWTFRVTNNLEEIRVFLLKLAIIEILPGTQIKVASKLRVHTARGMTFLGQSWRRGHEVAL